MTGAERRIDGYGDLLRRYRLTAKLTQEELAERSSLSVRAIADMERGRTARPRSHSVQQLSAALMLTPSARHRLLLAARGTSQPESDLTEPAAYELGDTAPAPIVPRQLPAGVRHFAGRVAALETLTGLLADAGRGGTVVCAISGPAGVGKTALALHWAHQVVDRFPDGQIYCDLRGFDASGTPATPREAICRILDAFQIPPGRIPASLDASAALYRSLLAERRMLIVLDNARDAEQVRPLLPGGPGCVAVVTSRSQLAGLVVSGSASPVTLDVLTESEARELLTGRLGSRRLAMEPAAVSALVGLCGLLPLALAVAAARAAVQPSLPLTRIADELLDASGRLDALDADAAAASVATVFSWSYQGLGKPEAKLFRLLSIHPGPDISAAAAASLAGTSLGQAHRALAELTGLHLLTERPAGRFAFHDLIRAYAADQARARTTERSRRAATQRALDHYLHSSYGAARLLNPARSPIMVGPPLPGVAPESHADPLRALNWFRAEHRVLLATIDQAADSGFDAYAWQLPWAMVDFLHRQSHWLDWAHTQRIAIAAAERLADRNAQARTHRDFGAAAIQLGAYDEAHAHLAISLELHQQLADPVGQARIHIDIGRIFSSQEEHRAALDHAQQALHLLRATNEPRWQAIAWNAVGWCLLQLGDYQRALSSCEEAIRLFRKSGDQHSEAETWDSIGVAHCRLGHYAEAITCCRRALSLIRETGHHWSQSRILLHLGEASDAAGDLDQAHSAWQEALIILRDLQHPDAAQVRGKLAGLRARRSAGRRYEHQVPHVRGAVI